MEGSGGTGRLQHERVVPRRLLDTYGADRLRQICGAPSDEFAARVNAVYGRALESLEADWLRFCDAWVG